MHYYRKDVVGGYMGPAGKMMLAGFLVAVLSLLSRLLSTIDGSNVY